MLIRTAKIEDLQQIAEVEAACFPPAEAATEDEFIQRLEYYKEHFWLMFDGDVYKRQPMDLEMTSSSRAIRPSAAYIPACMQSMETKMCIRDRYDIDL